MIECRNISFSYEDFALNEIEVLKNFSFKVQRGEKVLLLGNNGSGKSTLLKLLNALLYPKSGEYLFNGELADKKYIKKNSKVFRKSVAFCMQDPASMLFNPTVYDEIAFGLKLYGFSDVDERVHHMAKEFGITHLLNSSPLHLSTGQKQRVLLTALISTEPEVLLLDEPTAHLDAPSAEWFIEYLKGLDVTAIISTHNATEGLRVASRAIEI